MAKFITDMETWLSDYGDRLYRYLVYKKMFTPYEQQKAFSDESIFEDDHYELCKIEEAIDLGNGDWLLGLRDLDYDGSVYGIIHYYKLSEIQLSYFENDQSIELYEENEEDEND